MKFFNEEEERISERWTVRDQLSLGGTSCHLTESVLRKLVLDLMNKYRESKQSIIVSATFIDELRSFMDFGISWLVLLRNFYFKKKELSTFFFLQANRW
jgi:hypothetical protein